MNEPRPESLVDTPDNDTDVRPWLRTALFSSMAPGLLAVTLATVGTPVQACGGFFCQQTPINQAGEQIVFRQVGDRLTAMVRILYAGDAESFSWVVPVPNDPDVSLGDDDAFVDLDIATRPQFELERRGETCDAEFGTDGATGSFGAVDASAEDGDGVDILREFALGGFEVQVLGSNNGDPEEMATWLVDNGYDLSDRGRELLDPYVEAGMLFVALKLRSGASTGSIQPLVMTYRSEKPMIPIRLTAVAATPDMGIQTWIVGDERAVPENYLHVTPNYARLNWYTGSQNAYVSYQALITDAMNEVAAGGDNDAGQGFATDYAGPITAAIRDGLAPSILREQDLTAELAGLDTVADRPADFIVRALRGRDTSSGRMLPLRTELPLPDGLSEDVYFDATGLRENFTTVQLEGARDALREAIVKNEVEALRTSLDLLPEGAYMTRLYTTLSADEMSKDPVFGYNPDMTGQALTRRAVLDQSCGDNGTEWSLTLAEGTNRDGEIVIRANQPVPFSAPQATDTLDAAFLQERTAADARADIVVQANVSPLDIASDGSVSATSVLTASSDNDNDNGFLGLNGPITLTVLGLLAFRRRVRTDRPDAG